MADQFASFGPTPTGPGEKHRQLVANADADIDPRPRAIHCQADGTITIRDEDGEDLPYTLTAGQSIPFRGVRVTAISGGTFYGWS